MGGHVATCGREATRTVAMSKENHQSSVLTDEVHNSPSNVITIAAVTTDEMILCNSPSRSGSSDDAHDQAKRLVDPFCLSLDVEEGVDNIRGIQYQDGVVLMALGGSSGLKFFA